MGAKKNLLVGTVIIAAVLGYLVYLGASSPWQYYVLVDECYGQLDQWHGKRLRVSGRVGAGSLTITADRRNAAFSLEGKNHKFTATCRGPLPDNLTEEIDVVVEGKLQPDGSLQGERVITRCASKYAPKKTTEGTK